MAIDDNLTLNDKAVEKLGQQQTAVTVGPSGTSENKKTTPIRGARIFEIQFYIHTGHSH
jgi:hypothetical protein